MFQNRELWKYKFRSETLSIYRLGVGDSVYIGLGVRHSVYIGSGVGDSVYIGLGVGNAHPKLSIGSYFSDL